MLHLLPLLCGHGVLHDLQLLLPPPFRAIRHLLPVTELVQRHVAASAAIASLFRRRLLRLALLPRVIVHFPPVVIVILDVGKRRRVVILGVFLEVFHELVLRAVEVGYSLDFCEPPLEAGFYLSVGMEVGSCVDYPVLSEVGGGRTAACSRTSFDAAVVIFGIFCEDFPFVVGEGGRRVGRGIVVMSIVVTIIGAFAAAARFLFVLFVTLLPSVLFPILRATAALLPVFLTTIARSRPAGALAGAPAATAASVPAMAAAAAAALLPVLFTTTPAAAAVASVSGVIVIVLGARSRARSPPAGIALTSAAATFAVVVVAVVRIDHLPLPLAFHHLAAIPLAFVLLASEAPAIVFIGGGAVVAHGLPMLRDGGSAPRSAIGPAGEEAVRSAVGSFGQRQKIRISSRA
mmetsp:Transcript_17706/g.42654  ORF Transcript_17706/g.42654 Transcript_17706/m.42654 type:complete len:404 (-) Transcript_17706:20-1231(-)